MKIEKYPRNVLISIIRENMFIISSLIVQYRKHGNYPASEAVLQKAKLTRPGISDSPYQTALIRQPLSGSPYQTALIRQPLSDSPYQTALIRQPLSDSPYQTALIRQPLSDSPYQTALTRGLRLRFFLLSASWFVWSELNIH